MKKFFAETFLGCLFLIGGAAYFSRIAFGNTPITVDSPSELGALPSAEVPIQTKTEAITFALRSGSIFEFIEKAEDNAPFAKWKVYVLHNNNGWEVKIHSSGMLPSVACFSRFDENGVFPGDEKPGCRYNK